MRRTTITCLVALIACTAATAQTKLQGGAPRFNSIVKQPFFYYDLMRNEHNAWIRQYRPNAQQLWGNSNLLINRKDAEGRFEYLEYSLWDWTSETWIVYNKYDYDREQTNGNLTQMKQATWFRGQDNQLRNYFVEENYEYENGRLKSGTSSYNNQDGGQSDVSMTYFYDTQGRRIHDSESVDYGAYYYNSFYVYNGPGGKCSEQHQMINNDSMGYLQYSYDNDTRLSRYAEYRNDNHIALLNYEEVYAYDNEGRVTQVTLSYRDSTGMHPAARYEHGYNTLNKLQWMTYSSYENSQWAKDDSVYITYTGNKADTSYGYMSANGTDWNTYASFRFLFDETRVGLKDPVKNNLDFSLYPNPAKDMLNIGINENKPIERITITDFAGRQVAVYTNTHSTIDINGISAGLYVVKVETKDAVGVKKLAIE